MRGGGWTTEVRDELHVAAALPEPVAPHLCRQERRLWVRPFLHERLAADDFGLVALALQGVQMASSLKLAFGDGTSRQVRLA